MFQNAIDWKVLQDKVVSNIMDIHRPAQVVERVLQDKAPSPKGVRSNDKNK
jgi:hypothetical protein